MESGRVTVSAPTKNIINNNKNGSSMTIYVGKTVDCVSTVWHMHIRLTLGLEAGHRVNDDRLLTVIAMATTKTLCVQSAWKNLVWSTFLPSTTSTLAQC